MINISDTDRTRIRQVVKMSNEQQVTSSKFKEKKDFLAENNYPPIKEITQPLKHRTKMDLTINGERYKYTNSFTVFSLLKYLGFNKNLIVVDYNGTILQKEFWDKTYLKTHDSLEILTVAGGG